jgi:hypothetical protein
MEEAGDVGELWSLSTASASGNDLHIKTLFRRTIGDIHTILHIAKRGYEKHLFYTIENLMMRFDATILWVA